MSLGCPSVPHVFCGNHGSATVPGKGDKENGSGGSVSVLTSLWLCPRCLTSLGFSFVVCGMKLTAGRVLARCSLSLRGAGRVD